MRTPPFEDLLPPLLCDLYLTVRDETQPWTPRRLAHEIAVDALVGPHGDPGFGDELEHYQRQLTAELASVMDDLDDETAFRYLPELRRLQQLIAQLLEVEPAMVAEAAMEIAGNEARRLAEGSRMVASPDLAEQFTRRAEAAWKLHHGYARLAAQLLERRVTELAREADIDVAEGDN